MTTKRDSNGGQRLDEDSHNLKKCKIYKEIARRSLRSLAVSLHSSKKSSVDLEWSNFECCIASKFPLNSEATLRSPGASQRCCRNCSRILKVKPSAITLSRSILVILTPFLGLCLWNSILTLFCTKSTPMVCHTTLTLIAWKFRKQNGKITEQAQRKLGEIALCRSYQPSSIRHHNAVMPLRSSFEAQIFC